MLFGWRKQGKFNRAIGVARYFARGNKSIFAVFVCFVILFGNHVETGVDNLGTHARIIADAACGIRYQVRISGFASGAERDRSRFGLGRYGRRKRGFVFP